jgi:ribosome recycling factor
MIELILDDAAEKMDGAVTHTRQDFSGVRTGRATPVLVEKMPISYYGTEVPLQQIASFSVPEARMLLISPFDKESVGSIERAIRESDLGLSPSTDGVVVRLAFPALTEERRKALVKVVRGMAEDGRIALRNIRRSARSDLERMKKDGDAPEDAIDRAEKRVDDLTHGHEAEIDNALSAKEAELLEV